MFIKLLCIFNYDLRLFVFQCGGPLITQLLILSEDLFNTKLLGVANLQLVGQLGKNCCAGRNKPCCAGRSKACGTSLEPSGQLTVKSIRMLFMRFVYLAVTTSLSFETSFYFIQCIMLGHKSRSTTMLIVC